MSVVLASSSEKKKRPTVLKDISIDEISLVDRPANKRRFTVFKTEHGGGQDDDDRSRIEDLERRAEILEAEISEKQQQIDALDDERHELERRLDEREELLRRQKELEDELAELGVDAAVKSFLNVRKELATWDP